MLYKFETDINIIFVLSYYNLQAEIFENKKSPGLSIVVWKSFDSIDMMTVHFLAISNGSSVLKNNILTSKKTTVVFSGVTYYLILNFK